MKKVLKILGVITLSIFILILCFAVYLFALSFGVKIDESKLEDASASMYYILLYIGIAAASIIGVVLGIKFMAASAEDKAKVKEALIAYVISCVVLFGAYGIWRNVIHIVQETATTSTR